MVPPNLIWLRTGKSSRACLQCKDEFEQPEIVEEDCEDLPWPSTEDRLAAAAFVEATEKHRGPKANPSIICEMYR